MTGYDCAREMAASLQAKGPNDWTAHWKMILNRPLQHAGIRRMAQEALRNLGSPERIPGEDDEG